MLALVVVSLLMIVMMLIFLTVMMCDSLGIFLPYLVFVVVIVYQFLCGVHLLFSCYRLLMMMIVFVGCRC